MKKLLALTTLVLLVAGAILSPAEAKVNKACGKGKAAAKNPHCVQPTPVPTLMPTKGPFATPSCNVIPEAPWICR